MESGISIIRGNLSIVVEFATKKKYVCISCCNIQYLLSLAIFTFLALLLLVLRAANFLRRRRSLLLRTGPMRVVVRRTLLPPRELVTPRPRYDDAPPPVPPRNRRGGKLFGGPIFLSLGRCELFSRGRNDCRLVDWLLPRCSFRRLYDPPPPLLPS